MNWAQVNRPRSESGGGGELVVSLLAYLSNVAECSLLMQSFYSKPIPMPTSTSSGIVCRLNDCRVFFHVCPRDDRLNHDYFLTLLSSLSPSHIADLFEAILSSKRLLLFSNSLSKLTKCCLALSSLIFPFTWPYSFVSLMPSSWLDDLLDAPCPFIYGCLAENRKSLENKIDHDAIEIDLDLNTIEINCDDIHPLPMNLRQIFDSSLSYLTKFRLIKSDPTLVNIAVSEACLHVFTELFYRLPDYFQREKTSAAQSNAPDGHFSLCSQYFQSSADETPVETKSNRFDYTFRAEEFLSEQPLPSYRNFLTDFTKGFSLIFFFSSDDAENFFVLQEWSFWNSWTIINRTATGMSSSNASRNVNKWWWTPHRSIPSYVSDRLLICCTNSWSNRRNRQIH